ncbi:hypothetical protein [Sphingobacterium zeae]|uniref:hypothetical protein n=1 Tax=Sphingobacterium zeae TaxID=1776859 RepID=UPI00362390C9
MLLVLEEIQFTPQPNDHPQSPYVIPEEVVFNKNGMAFLTFLGNQLINYKTKTPIGQPIQGAYWQSDTKNKLIYAITWDQQYTTWIVCYDLNAKELYRRPFFYDTGGSSYVKLAGNGKYIVYYNGYSEELFRFSIDFFKGKTKLENWEL